MRVAIVGSRVFPNAEVELAAVFKKWAGDPEMLPSSITVVSGGAPGVDRIAITAAEDAGYQTEVIPADWARFGKRAGIIRNAELVATVDAVLALWDGASPGTRSTIDQALRQRKQLEVVFP